MATGNSSECIILGILPWRPHLVFNLHTKSTPEVTGTMLEVLDTFAKRFHFCYKFVMPPSQTGGVILPNGSWTGMMKLLVQKEIEFTGVGLMPHHMRTKEVDFSDYLYMDEWGAAYQRPTFQSDMAGFIKPFTLSVSLFILLVIAIVWPTFYAVRVVSAKLSKSQSKWQIQSKELGSPKRDNLIKMTSRSSFLYESAAWTIGPLINQALPSSPKVKSVRLLTSVWILAAYILAVAYQNNLKAMLILPKIKLPFDSMEELVESQLPVLSVPGTIFHSTAMNAPKDSLFGRVSKQFLATDGKGGYRGAMYKMLQGEYVFMLPLSVIVETAHRFFSQTGECLLYSMSKGYLKTSMHALAFPKNSPWRAKLNPLIIRLRESGILDHLYLKGVNNATECLKPVMSERNTKLRPLDLGDFYGIFLVYAGGLAVAIFAFAAEKMPRAR